MPEVLTEAQIAEYREVGGIVVQDRLTQADLDEVRAAIADTNAGKNINGKVWFDTATSRLNQI